jgi:1,4-dihydroxy-2-naphthoate octaprenyltransferase
MTLITTLVRLTRPLQLLLTALTYGLGLGFARYLGTPTRVELAFLGGGFILLCLAAANLLGEYFRPFNEPIVVDETPAERAELRGQLLVSALVLLASAGLMVFVMLWNGRLTPLVEIFLGLIVLLAFANGVPPIRLSDRGFGEFVTALLMANAAPALAFLLQKNDLHRLLPMLTLPLTLLALAYLLALDFPAYSQDLKYQRGSLLARLGWQRAVPLHNVMLAAAYLIYAAAPLVGFSFNLIWPALLTIPLAAYQVFMLRNISEGAKPLWNAFIVNATALFGLTAYLLTLTFWLR